nr:efflux transporter outer membrane subunit [uncultured Methylophaga sp.]
MFTLVRMPIALRRPLYQLLFLTVITGLFLSGCASTFSEDITDDIDSLVASRWHAPLPHNGELEKLNQWWSQFDDPLMLQLIADAQQVSPTLAQAVANIADARAAVVNSRAALLPSLDGSVNVEKSRSDISASPINLTSAGLQASWELDIFGANSAAADATSARLAFSQADWHDARILVAAEVANTYTELRACEAKVQQYQQDATSRVNTSRLTKLSVKAGFRPPAEAALATASAAQGKIILVQQQTQCDLLIKTLTALTAQDETALRSELAVANAMLPQETALTVSSVPAEVISQRPDIYAAAREVTAASADANQAQAQRWPRITLSGNISASSMKSSGVSTDGSTWSIGPVAITLPLLDGGSRRANAEAARIRYDVALTIYAARLREAIQEVENALVTLQSTATRSMDADIAETGFERSYEATESSYKAGIASLFDLEDARRSMISAKIATIELQRERIAAWIAFYRAVGGGWSITELQQTSNLPQNTIHRQSKAAGA